MARTILDAFKPVRLGADGAYTLNKPGSAFSVKWEAEGVTPAGTVTLSFDGDPGLNAEKAVIDLSRTSIAGSRTARCNMTLPYVDIDVAGLPEGGEFIFYVRD